MYSSFSAGNYLSWWCVSADRDYAVWVWQFCTNTREHSIVTRKQTPVVPSGPVHSFIQKSMESSCTKG